MQTQQFIVLALAAMMILVATKINVTQLIEVLQRLGPGGVSPPNHPLPGGVSPPNHPLPGDDSYIVLRRRRKSTY